MFLFLFQVKNLVVLFIFKPFSGVAETAPKQLQQGEKHRLGEFNTLIASLRWVYPLYCRFDLFMITFYFIIVYFSYIIPINPLQLSIEVVTIS